MNNTVTIKDKIRDVEKFNADLQIQIDQTNEQAIRISDEHSGPPGSFIGSKRYEECQKLYDHVRLLESQRHEMMIWVYDEENNNPIMLRNYFTDGFTLQIETGEAIEIEQHELYNLLDKYFKDNFVKSGCTCKNVGPSSYDNQTIVEMADHTIELRYNAPGAEVRKDVCIDTCLLEEIKYLWSLGIVTTGCCCGHQKHPGFIGVEDIYIPKMKSLGYEVSFNRMRPNDEDEFTPKYLPLPEISKQSASPDVRPLPTETEKE